MKTIAWDVDDVLNNLMQEWLQKKWCKETKLTVKYEEIIENPPHKILNISLDDYLSSLDSFRLSNMYQEMKPDKKIVKWFSKYGHLYRHLALTSTPLLTASTTAQWVFKHFGRWIRTFHFIPSKRNNINAPQYDKDKSEFLLWFSRIDIFIDDNKKNIDSAKKAGINAVIWPQPWNNSNLSPDETLGLLNVLLVRKA
ncbi:hypothetical protein [Thermodesulfovibrio thiophilus]|uniref:hypothetical protein n=1 Tax=Thermodesulfovibrio thiophilus TaxID=340095 RepID=UPI00184F7402|nr:hypothetical protein [Thermodesulfovibrio thiophilus]HHW21228.1 hypothetical protein [Thermodesulfovibrio thiophilus]